MSSRVLLGANRFMFTCLFWLLIALFALYAFGCATPKSMPWPKPVMVMDPVEVHVVLNPPAEKFTIEHNEELFKAITGLPRVKARTHTFPPPVALRLPAILADSDVRTEAAIKTAQMIDASGIDVYLDGKGGFIMVGFQISSDLNRANIPIRCIVNNSAISMDAWLFELISCKRVMDVNAVLYFHRPFIPRPVDTASMTDEATFTKVEARLTNILCLALVTASRGAVSVEICEAHMDEPEMWAVDAPTALLLNLVDEVTTR